MWEAGFEEALWRVYYKSRAVEICLQLYVQLDMDNVFF